MEIINDNNRKKILMGIAEGKKIKPIKNKYFPISISLYLEFNLL